MAVSDINNVLTSGEIEGTGSFDVLMRTVKEHIKTEFEAGRIRATDYANAYVQITTAVLGQATQFAISQTRLESELALQEAQIAQIQQETANAIEQQALIKAQAAQIKQETLNAAAQNAQILEQTKDITAATGIKEYQLSTVMPLEVTNLTKQGLNLDAQTEQIEQNTLNAIAQNTQIVEQTAEIKANTSIKEYQLDSVMPLEVANLTKQGLSLDAQTEQTKQQTTNLTKQALQIEAQTSLTEQQTTNLTTDNEHAIAKHVLDMQSIEVQIAKVTTDTVVATKQAALIDAQAIGEQSRTQNTEASTRRVDYETNFMLPAQLLAVEEQTTLTTKQHEQTTQQTLNLAAEKERLMKQTAQIAAETSLRNIEVDLQTYKRDFMQPVEYESMQKDMELKENQVLLNNKEILLKQAQVDLSVKEIELKDSQISLGTKELLLKQAQVDVAEKELLLKAEQISISKFELANKLPAEVSLLAAQNDLYVQKTITEKAQVDNTVVGLNSVTDINNKLVLEQSKTYLRTFQQNTAKMLIDTWNVRHTADPDGNLENSANKLVDSNIGRVLDKLALELGITLV